MGLLLQYLILQLLQPVLEGKVKSLERKDTNFFQDDFWIILLVLVGFAHSCPKVCPCSLEKTTCSFTRCSDAVPLSETYMLEIHGPI